MFDLLVRELDASADRRPNTPEKKSEVNVWKAPGRTDALKSSEIRPAYRFGSLAHRYPSDLVKDTSVRDTANGKLLRLWHYTSATGFQGIVDGMRLRMGNVRFMSDTREIVHGQELALNLLKHGSYEREWADKISNWLQRLQQSNRGVYIFCLSEDGNDLSQWRAYCHDGIGYSIGFEPRRLRALTEKQGCDLVKVDYDSASQTGRIKRLLEAWSHKATKILSDQHGRQLQGEFQHDFTSLAAQMKSRAFEAEHEWRLICHPVEDTDQRLRFWPDLLIPTPYLEIGFDPLQWFDWDELEPRKNLVWPIHHVYAGPSPVPDQSNEMAELLLRRLGYGSIETPVWPSGIPYRGRRWIR